LASFELAKRGHANPQLCGPASDNHPRASGENHPRPPSRAERPNTLRGRTAGGSPQPL